MRKIYRSRHKYLVSEFIRNALLETSMTTTTTTTTSTAATTMVEMDIRKQLLFYVENTPTSHKRKKVVDYTWERFRRDVKRKRFDKVYLDTTLVDLLLEV